VCVLSLINRMYTGDINKHFYQQVWLQSHLW